MSSEFASTHYPFDLSDLPKSWLAVPIAEITLDVQPGFACGKHNTEGLGIPHLRPMNINPQGEIDLSEIRFIHPDKPLRLSINDILFNNTNSPAWVGKTAIIKDSNEYAFSNHMTRLKVPAGINPDFLAKQLHFLQQCGYFLQQCTKHVNQASISSKFLCQSVPIIVPPINEQQRIIKKITVLQAKCKKIRKALEAIPSLLEKFRQSVLSSAFRGDLTADWRAQNPDVEPAEKLLERIRKERRKRWEEDELTKMEAKGKTPKDDKWKAKYKEPEPVDATDLPELPEGWVYASLEEVCNKITDGAHHTPKPTESGFPYITAQHVKNRQINFSESFFLPEDEHKIIFNRAPVKKGDVLCVNIGAGTGTPALVRVDFEFSMKNVALLKPDVNCIIGEYLEFYQLYKRDSIFQNVTRGGAQPFLSLRLLRSLPVILPPKEEQIILAHTINILFEKVDALTKPIMHADNRLKELNQSILSKAFRGELVPQDPNDEPASILLERIKQEKASLKTGKKR